MTTVADFNSPSRIQGFAELAPIFKASGDPMRLEVLRILERDAYGVLELASIFGVGQSAMSHHLKVLARAGLVETQREGNSIFYRRPLLAEPGPANAAREHLFASVDSVEVSPETRAGIAQVREQRALQSQAFFARFADEFKAHQELIAEFELYARPAADLLRRCLGNARQTGLEIGPGEGAFLPELSQLFKQVIALDNSAEMLESARQLAERDRLGNVRLVHGTTSDLVAEGIYVDAIIINMVLHHVPSPASMLAECAQLLNPGGILIISELSRHNQTWAKESCGDLWLGFKSDEISQWAHQAGLEDGESVYIGVRNGFQIQVRQFVLPATTLTSPTSNAVTTETKSGITSRDEYLTTAADNRPSESVQ